MQVLDDPEGDVANLSLVADSLQAHSPSGAWFVRLRRKGYHLLLETLSRTRGKNPYTDLAFHLRLSRFQQIEEPVRCIQ